MALLSKAEVKDRLFEAARTIRKLPKHKLQGFISTWPDVAPDKNLAYGYNETVTRDEAGRQQTSEAYEMFRWIWAALPEGYPRRLVCMRAFEVPWKMIAYSLEWGERKVRNDFDTFLMEITLHIARQDRELRIPKPVRLPSGAISSSVTRTIFKPCVKPVTKNA